MTKHGVNGAACPVHTNNSYLTRAVLIIEI